MFVRVGVNQQMRLANVPRDANIGTGSLSLCKLVDVCCPTVCDSTDAKGVSREVHVCSSKSDVEEACLCEEKVLAQDVDECTYI